MQFLFDAVERAKQKPHHIRHRIAVSVAGIGAGFVALVWLSVSLSQNAFAIKGTTFAESVGATNTVETVTETRSQQVAGAGAALDAKTDDGPARIQIVNVVATSTPAPAKEQTIIPF